MSVPRCNFIYISRVHFEFAIFRYFLAYKFLHVWQTSLQMFLSYTELDHLIVYKNHKLDRIEYMCLNIYFILSAKEAIDFLSYGVLASHMRKSENLEYLEKRKAVLPIFHAIPICRKF